MSENERNVVPERDPFPRSSAKTYNLVEVVHGPTPMVDKGPDDTVFAFPLVAILELLLLLGMMTFLFFFSLLKDAPLEELANPLVTTDPAKAPWYFMGLQEMLEHMHPTLAGVILPAVAVLFLMAIPYLDHERRGAGLWFGGARARRIVLWTSIYALLSMVAFVLLDNAFPPREMLRSKLPALVTQSLIPLAVMSFLVVLPAIVLWKKSSTKPTARELMLVLFTMLLVSSFVLTMTGFFFRGPGFELYAPWNMPNGYNPLDSL